MAPGADNEGFVSNGDAAAYDQTTVAVVGAGPAGLMLASNLVRFGIKTTLFDDREDKTSTGKADGLQPKTIETFKQLRLADSLIRKGVKVYDIAFWDSAANAPITRTGRQIHYPDIVGALEPYVLLVHQGMIEDVLIEDMQERGVQVVRSSPFVECSKIEEDGSLFVTCDDLLQGTSKSVRAEFLVGTDGSHSKVRQFIPGAMLVGEISNACWGVLDGVIETDFPDLWSKFVVRSETAGTVLGIPRERNMTRFYIELSSKDGERVPKSIATQEYVMKKAREVMAPYKLEWKSVEWFGNYVIGQRVANHFVDEDQKIFIAGDAGHTHSPKAAQGMNTSMHDSFNLAWKLNLTIRGLAQPALLATYEQERRKIANDLIDFDTSHVKAFAEGEDALARNFIENIRFIAGVGVEYSPNVLNEANPNTQGDLKIGAILTPARVSRYIDANPIDIQLDIPLLSQFRVYFFVPDAHAAKDWLATVCSSQQNQETLIGRVSAASSKSYELMTPNAAESDSYIQPQRYTPVSKVFTYALVTRTPKAEIEIADLPPLLQASRWTFYMDDVTEPSCTQKWLGELSSNEVGIVNVRPDGYVGSIGRWNVDIDGSAGSAAGWLESYYGGFLKA